MAFFKFGLKRFYMQTIGVAQQYHITVFAQRLHKR